MHQLYVGKEFTNGVSHTAHVDVRWISPVTRSVHAIDEAATPRIEKFHSWQCVRFLLGLWCRLLQFSYRKFHFQVLLPALGARFQKSSPAQLQVSVPDDLARSLQPSARSVGFLRVAGTVPDLLAVNTASLLTTDAVFCGDVLHDITCLQYVLHGARYLTFLTVADKSLLEVIVAAASCHHQCPFIRVIDSKWFARRSRAGKYPRIDNSPCL